MKINISNLKEGVHYYQFTVGSVELGLEDNQVLQADVHLNVSLNKIGEDLVADVAVKTEGSFVCDRCLENFTTEVGDQLRLLFTTEPQMGPSADEIHFVSPGEQEIDLTEDVRQTLLLAAPMKHLCSEECKGLCPRCGVNLNFESCNCQPEMDPRWEALKKIKFSQVN